MGRERYWGCEEIVRCMGENMKEGFESRSLGRVLRHDRRDTEEPLSTV